MSEVKKTADQQRERLTRIIAHARAGKTMSEIVDLEGLDAGNTKRWHKAIRDAGIKINMSRQSGPPEGLKRVPAHRLARLHGLIVRLRMVHSQIEVSRMTGLTNAEMRASSKSLHNWTVAQIQRLAEAHELTFNEVINPSLTEVYGGKYRAVSTG